MMTGKARLPPLNALRVFHAVVQHCEKGFRRAKLPPREPNGEIASWYPN